MSAAKREILSDVNAQAVRKVRPKLGEAIVEQLTHDIVAGKYQPGNVLPPEPVLGEIFAVSRTVVRDAIGALVAKNLVEPRRGIGTIVLPRSGWKLLDPLVLSAAFDHDTDGVYLDSMISVRASLESMMAEKAAANASAEDIEQLRAQLTRMGDMLDDPQRYIVEDMELHRLIMRASQDILGPVIVEDFQGRAFPVRKYHGNPNRKHLDHTHRDHAAIVEAIAGGYTDVAAMLMRQHILGSWSRRREDTTTLDESRAVQPDKESTS